MISSRSDEDGSFLMPERGQLGFMCCTCFSKHLGVAFDEGGDDLTLTCLRCGNVIVIPTEKELDYGGG